MPFRSPEKKKPLPTFGISLLFQSSERLEVTLKILKTKEKKNPQNCPETITPVRCPSLLVSHSLSTVSAEPVFWFYVKEVLNKHELQRFCSLRHITSDVGRGWAWLRCALNKQSLERYLHMLLADRGRLSTF
ncbi:Sorting Nexin-29 [Manis pentadactyla]|nr:Sorting Nexin-29 [Manis pentadactyla]